MGWNTSIFPLLIITPTGGFTGLFVYSPGPGTGNLIASIASQAGTDPFGNPYQEGVTAYIAGTPTDFAQLLGVALTFGNAGNTSNPELGGSGDALLLTSGATAALPVTAELELLPVASGLGVALFAGTEIGFSTGGPPADTTISRTAAGQVTIGSSLIVGTILTNLLELTEQAVPAATSSVQVIGNTSGHAEVVSDNNNGDSLDYDIERLFLHATALPQSIASAVAATITGCSKTVGKGRYRYKAYISYHGAGAAGTAKFCIAGTLTETSFDAAAIFITSGGTAGTSTSATFGSGGPVTSPTLTTGANIAYIEGEIVVSVAGTMLLQAFEGTAGDAFTIDNCKFDLWPVVAT